MKGKIKYFAPAGYFPCGKARPWREVKILLIQDEWSRIKYLDTGEIATCYHKHLRKEINK